MPTKQLQRPTKRSYATEAEKTPVKPPSTFMSATAPGQRIPIGQEYWARAAAAPKPTLADFKPTRKALLELTIADNASPMIATPNKPIPKELHAMVEELMQGEWPVSTSNAIGIYLDGLCRRERVCRRELNRIDLMIRRAKLNREADPWTKAMSESETDLPEKTRYQKELAESWQYAKDIFARILEQEQVHVPHRYIGSFLATCGQQGDVETARVAFDYSGRTGSRPIYFHFFLLQAHAQNCDYAGAHATYEAFIQARMRLREQGMDSPGAFDVQTSMLRYNTRRYRIGTTYVGEPVNSIDDAAAAMGAMMIKTAFETGHHYYANRMFHAMIRQDDLAPPIRPSVILEYLVGTVKKRTEKEAMKTLEWVREKPELRKSLCSTPYNYRALLRLITDQEPRRPAALAHAYRCLMIDSKEFGFAHFTSELHVTIDTLVACAVDSNRKGDWSVHILRDCVNILTETRLDEAEGRMVAETTTVDKWYRLSTHVTYRLVGALALFGMHTPAVEIYRELVKAALPGLRTSQAIVQEDEVERLFEDDGAIPMRGNGNASICSTPMASTRSVSNLAPRIQFPSRSGLHTTPTPTKRPVYGRPAHAFLMLGAHALGERVIGAEPSLLNIVDVWRAQERILAPRATRWMMTKARIKAELHPEQFDQLPPKHRRSFNKLIKAWTVHKYYPTRIVTRNNKAFEAILSGRGGSKWWPMKRLLAKGDVVTELKFTHMDHRVS